MQIRQQLQFEDRILHDHHPMLIEINSGQSTHILFFSSSRSCLSRWNKSSQSTSLQTSIYSDISRSKSSTRRWKRISLCKYWFWEEMKSMRVLDWWQRHWSWSCSSWQSSWNCYRCSIGRMLVGWKINVHTVCSSWSFGDLFWTNFELSILSNSKEIIHAYISSNIDEQ